MPDNSRLWDRRQDFAERHPILALFGWGLGITLAIGAIVVVISVIMTGSVFFQSGAASATVKARENIQRNSTGNAVQSIAFFHNTCEDFNRQAVIVRTNVARAERLTSQAAKATSAITQQQAVDQANQASTDAAGAFNALVATATDYNAKAANSLNAKFRESGLPERLPLPTDPSADLPAVNCG